MTDQQINIAVAKACGWKLLLSHHSGTIILPDGTGGTFTPGSWAEELFNRRIPNYTSDLNAMHDAERVLTPKQWDEYVRHLNNGFVTFDIEDVGRLLFTPARQRAEAFLRTLGKWEDQS